MTLTELDTLRAETMALHLNNQGRDQIWKYDIVHSNEAVAMALDDCNYDNIERGMQGIREGKPYAFIGPGICDHPFATPRELVNLVRWLCIDGYLSCYTRIEREP